MCYLLVCVLQLTSLLELVHHCLILAFLKSNKFYFLLFRANDTKLVNLVEHSCWHRIMDVELFLYQLFKIIKCPNVLYIFIILFLENF